jgi:hypothetical protein
MLRPALALLLPALLAGCEMLGMESAERIAALKEADGKAVGSACRHATRAIEDCFALNPRAQKASVYAGWREMDEYMRENKIEGIVPASAQDSARGAPIAAASGDGTARAASDRKAAPSTGNKTAHAS